MRRKLRVRAATIVLALIAAGGFTSCGGGGGGGGDSSGSSVGATSTTFTGLVWNSPVDGIVLTATCADGTTGGTAVASLGAYSITVTCAAANFPIVIATTGDGLLAGPDLQFGTADDTSYKLAERSPLKVAIGDNATTTANITALSTLAAQPIEDKILAYKAAPTSASKPTLADVQAAERNAVFALGLGSTDVKKANPLTDPQLARVFGQILSAIAAVRSLGPSTTSPEDVMKSFAQAAQLGGSGGAGTAGTLYKVEADGLNSFDLQTTKAALTTAAATVAGSSLGSTAAQMTAVNGLLTDALTVEPSIKSTGTETEQVIRAISAAASVQGFDPAKGNFGVLATAISGALTNPSTNAAGNAAALMVKVASEALRQAATKAQEIEASTTILAAEKANRKRAVFAAAEAIRSAQEYDIIVKTAAAVMSADEVSRAIAQVSLAVGIAGDLMKTATLTDVVDVTANKPKPDVAGVAARVRSDVGTQIASKSSADLGDLKNLNPQTVLGAAQVATIGTTATNIVALLTDFSPPPAAGDLAVRATLAAVVESISGSANLVSAKATIQSTAASLSGSLNGSTTQSVTVGPAINVPVNTLPADVQTRLLTLAAHTLIGPTKLDYSSPPTIPSATSAITSAAAVVSKTLAATKTQSIAWGAPPALAVGAPGTLSASGGASGNAVTFSSTTPGVCTVSGNTVTGLSAGTCVVAADQAGNATYLAAAEVTQSIAVGKGSQTITFGALPAVTVGGSGGLNATGGASGNAVTFSSTTTTVCTVSGSTVTGVSSGSCVIAADQAGNANYAAAAQVTQTLTVGKISQTITFGAAPPLTVGASAALSATGGASGSPVIFSSTTPSICTVSGSTVTGASAGACVVAANQAGSTSYAAAAQVTQTITIGKIDQSITFAAAPILVVGGSAALNATGGASGSAIVFSSTTTGICTVSGNTVTGVSAGSCVVAANQAGSASYNAAAQATQTISVSQIAQVIVFGAPPSVVVGGTGSLIATGGASSNPVVFGTATPATCTVAGGVVSGVSAGACVVTANQVGNASFSAAGQVTQSITVGKGNQSISFGPAPSVAAGGTGTLMATGGLSGNPITFSSNTTGVCTVSASTVTGVAAGTCMIAADQAGNANYLAASQVTQTFTVTPSASPFSGICQVQLASAIGYVTGVSSSERCNSSVLNVDGYGATVSIGPATPIAGKTVIDFSALSTCDPFGAPPGAGATTLTPCKR